jgi:hypothetical protein
LAVLNGETCFIVCVFVENRRLQMQQQILTG